MGKRLHFFYQLQKKGIRLLYISSTTFSFLRIIYVVFCVALRVDRLNGYIGKPDLSFGQKICQIIIHNIASTSFFIFSYFCTKYMDFALYVKVWMIGHKVDNKFENMSYLIIPSCFYRDDLQDSESNDSELKNSFSDSI